MNLILSIILCIAMAAGGAAQLPAEPEAMSEWIISNVTVSESEQSVTLDKEAVLRGAVSENEALFSFHINNGDSVMLPMAAKLDADEFLLSFGSGTRAYGFSDELIVQEGELSEEDVALLDELSAFFMDLGVLLVKVQDPEYSEKISERMLAIDEKIYGESKATEVEIDGALYTGEYRRGEYRDQDMYGMLDEIDCSDLPELETVLDGLLKLLCDMEGADAEKGYADLIEGYLADSSVTAGENVCEITTVKQDDLEYSKTITTASDEENGYESLSSTEVIARSDSTRFSLYSRDQTEDLIVEIGLKGDGVGEDALEALDAQFSLRVMRDYSAPVEWSDEEIEYIYTEEETVNATIKVGSEDGLWSVDLDVDGMGTTTKGYADDYLEEEQPFEFHFAVTEHRSEAGELIRSFSLEEDALKLSFDLLSRECELEDPFADMPSYAVDLENEKDPSLMLISADVMMLSSQAMLLSAQDDIIAISELLEKLDPYGQYTTLESLEEAQERFEAPMPAFTPPDGYELEQIEISEDGDNVDCYYWSAATGKSIIVSYYDFRGKAKYEGLDEEALAKGPIVHSEVTDGCVEYIDVYTPEVNVFFTVDNITLAEMENLLSRLDVVSLYMDEDDIAAKQEASKRKL